MVRVEYEFPSWARVGILVLLLLWALLVAYLVGYTNPPLGVSVLLTLPFLALAWTLAATYRRVAWEANESGLSKRSGKETRVLVKWENVRAISVGSGAGPRGAVLAYRPKGRGRSVRVVAGAGIDREGVRTLYEASAYYLKRHGVLAENPFGWRDILPLTSTKPTRGERVPWIIHVAWALIVSGALAVPGSLGGSPGSLGVGLGLIAIGAAVFVLAVLRGRKHAAGPEPEYRINE